MDRENMADSIQGPAKPGGEDSPAQGSSCKRHQWMRVDTWLAKDHSGNGYYCGRMRRMEKLACSKCPATKVQWMKK